MRSAVDQRFCLGGRRFVQWQQTVLTTGSHSLWHEIHTRLVSTPGIHSLSRLTHTASPFSPSIDDSVPNTVCHHQPAPVSTSLGHHGFRLEARKQVAPDTCTDHSPAAKKASDAKRHVKYHTPHTTHHRILAHHLKTNT